MDMDKLLALRTLAEEGTQMRAAEKLFCTQSALSKQINTLERELDCRLFDRKGSRLVLNGSGQKAYAYAVSCLDGYARLQAGFAAAGKDVYGIQRDENAGGNGAAVPSGIRLLWL